MKGIYLLIFSALNYLNLYSQNDLCENAVVIFPTNTCNYISGSFSSSSLSSPDPSCASNSIQDVWYSFVATATTISVTLQLNSNANLAFEVFLGSCTGTNLVCINNNPISFGEFYTNNNFVVGQTYYVRVLNASGNLSTANFGICVQNYPTPVNDLCSNAIIISPTNTCNYISGTFSGSSISAAAPSCASNSFQDVWYSFVATAPTMSVALQANSNLNHAFEIIQGNCGGNSLVCVNNNAISIGEFYLNNNFTVGQIYYVRVLNALGNLTSASFGICVQNYPTPTNDLCTDAISITPSTTCNYLSGSFSGSSSSSATPSCASSSLQDVWYSFVATDPTMSVALQANSNVNHAFEIIQGNCSGNSLVCVNNNAISIGEFYLNNNFTVGQIYYVRVLNALGNLTTASFGICIQNPALGIDDFQNTKFIIHPNPAQDIITIDTSESIKEILVFDISGKKVAVRSGSVNSIDISSLTQGIYIIKIVGENETYSSKLIKE